MPNNRRKPNSSRLVWSPPKVLGADAAWWCQQVVFNGQYARRIDVAHGLSSLPGMTEQKARRLLEAAPLAAVFTTADAGLRPPWYWDAKVFFNGKPATRREVKAILEAHRVPPGYIAQFLDTAEAPGEEPPPGAEDQDDDASDLANAEGLEDDPDVIEGEIASIMQAANHDDTNLTPADKKRLEELHQELDAVHDAQPPL